MTRRAPEGAFGAADTVPHTRPGGPMTDFLAEVTRRAAAVVRLDESGGDPETAHCDQDNLAHEVLEHIVEHSTDERSRQLAAQVLRTFTTDGERWYA